MTSAFSRARRSRRVRIVARASLVATSVLLAVDVLVLLLGLLATAAPTTPKHSATTAPGPAFATVEPGSAPEEAAFGSFPGMKSSDVVVEGDDFTLHILGYGIAPQIDTNFGVVDTVPGYTLAILKYDLQYNGSAAPDISIRAGKSYTDFASADSLSGQWEVEIAVPDGSAPVLTASGAGISQGFSFATGLNTAPVVPIMYRNPDDSPELTDRSGSTVDLPITGARGIRVGSDAITLSRARLTYFSPAAGSGHPPASDAYLVIAASESGSASWFGDGAVSPRHLSLLLPSGKTVACQADSPYAGNQASNLLDGNYFFEVPSSFTSGTLVVTLGSHEGNMDGPDAAIGSGMDTIVGSARFKLAFPVGRGAPPTKAPRPVAAKKPTADHKQAPRPRKDRSPWANGPLVFGGLDLLALFSTLPFISRRRLPGTAVDASGRVVSAPPALPHVARLALMPGPPTDTAEPVGDGGQQPRAVPSPPPGPRPEPKTEEDVCIYILGPFYVTGLRRKVKRNVILAILCYLACHRDGKVSGDQIREALWPAADDFDSLETSRDSFTSYMSMLRGCVGEARLPRAASGYELGPGVTTDWQRFQELCSVAKSSAPEVARQQYEAALSLIRGKPFSGTSERFEWAQTDGTLSAIERGVARAARESVRLAIDSGDRVAAAWAAKTALLVVDEPWLHSLAAQEDVGGQNREEVY